VQEAALVDDQVSVEDWPAGMVVGDADRETVGAGGTITVTSTLFEATPPGPVQVTM